MFHILLGAPGVVVGSLAIVMSFIAEIPINFFLIAGGVYVLSLV